MPYSIREGVDAALSNKSAANRQHYLTRVVPRREAERLQRQADAAKARLDRIRSGQSADGPRDPYIVFTVKPRARLLALATERAGGSPELRKLGRGFIHTLADSDLTMPAFDSEGTLAWEQDECDGGPLLLLRVVAGAQPIGTDLARDGQHEPYTVKPRESLCEAAAERAGSMRALRELLRQFVYAFADSGLPTPDGSMEYAWQHSVADGQPLLTLHLTTRSEEPAE